MANSYYTPSQFIPYTLVEADGFNESENKTEAAFDLLPAPITTGDKGFTQQFKVKQAPTDTEHVARLYDIINNASNYGTATTTDSIYFRVTINPGPSSLYDGLSLCIKMPENNTGRAYLNLNSLGDREIVKFNGDVLTGNELTKDQVVRLSYVNGTFQLTSHTSAVAPEAPSDGKSYVRKNEAWVEGADKTYIDTQDTTLQSQITSNDNDISNLQTNKADKTYVDAQDTALQNDIDTKMHYENASSNIDLDTIRTTGIYGISSNVNIPGARNVGVLIVSYHHGYTDQMWFAVDEVYTRRYSGGTWSAWTAH